MESGDSPGLQNQRLGEPERWVRFPSASAKSISLESDSRGRSVYACGVRAVADSRARRMGGSREQQKLDVVTT